MEQDDHKHLFEIAAGSIPRRAVLLGGAALGMFGMLGRGDEGRAQMGIPFEGQEPACRADFQPVPFKTEDLDGIEGDFIRLSEAVTGVRPLDRNLARQYLERFASHPQLAGALMLLIDAFRDLRTPARRTTA